MKTAILTVSALAGALLWVGCETAPSTSEPAKPEVTVSADGRIDVIFENAVKFTDLKSSANRETDETYMTELRRFVDRDARRYLAESEKLVITFTDIDMAGDFEPWRPNAQDVRLMKATYPPRLVFTWKVTDASGAVVRQGSEALTDLNYAVRVGNITRDELFFEKELLGDWMRLKLRAPSAPAS